MLANLGDIRAVGIDEYEEAMERIASDPDAKPLPEHQAILKHYAVQGALIGMSRERGPRMISVDAAWARAAQS